MRPTPAHSPPLDPPASVYGVPPQAGSLTSPFVDPTIPPERKMGAFLEWVSAHCSTLPPGVPISVAALEAHSRALPRPPTLHTLSPEMLERCLDRDVGPRSLAGVSVVDPSIHQRHVRTAVGDADAVLPGVDVLSLWCDGSVWLTTWGTKTLGDIVQEPAEAGKKKRKVSFLRVRGANHFVSLRSPADPRSQAECIWYSSIAMSRREWSSFLQIAPTALCPWWTQLRTCYRHSES